MSKYVCNYDEVKKKKKRLRAIADEMSTSTDTYSNKVSGDLQEWSGEAKDAFNDSNTTKVTKSNASTAALKEVATFIEKAAESIEATDKQFANKKI